MIPDLSVPRQQHAEKGNVLFLILIAVALFAALSYAVTQSTRSGGGSTERERALLGSATLSQYPTAIRTSLVRMILGGADIRNLIFNAPAGFSAVSSGEHVLLVFHPDGGGAVYQDAPANIMANAQPGTWYYNAEIGVPRLGRDDAMGNDVIAFLPGVNQAVCERMNEELGFTYGDQCGGSYQGRVPDISGAVSADNFTVQMDEAYRSDFPLSPKAMLECSSGENPFEGQASGCFYHDGVSWGDGESGGFVFYSVLLER